MKRNTLRNTLRTKFCKTTKLTAALSLLLSAACFPAGAAVPHPQPALPPMPPEFAASDRYLAENNIFLRQRGFQEVIIVPLVIIEDIQVAGTKPAPLEKQYVLTGVSFDADGPRAFIESTSKYEVITKKVGDLLSPGRSFASPSTAGMPLRGLAGGFGGGIISRITLEGVYYQADEKSDKTMMIPLGHDFTGAEVRFLPSNSVNGSNSLNTLNTLNTFNTRSASSPMNPVNLSGIGGTIGLSGTAGQTSAIVLNDMTLEEQMKLNRINERRKAQGLDALEALPGLAESVEGIVEER